MLERAHRQGRRADREFQAGDPGAAGARLPVAHAHRPNPRLESNVSISGYGQTGPQERPLPATDAVVQAESGVMSITGPATDEAAAGYRFGLPIADLAAGLFAAQGTLLALLARTQAGRGEYTSICRCSTRWPRSSPTRDRHNFATGTQPPRMGNAPSRRRALRHLRRARRPIMLAVGNDNQWRRFCDIAGLCELATDERFATNPQRVTNRVGPAADPGARHPDARPRRLDRAVPARRASHAARCGTSRRVAGRPTTGGASE